MLKYLCIIVVYIRLKTKGRIQGEPMDYSSKLAKEFSLKEEYAKNIIALIEDGNTIPFIARYRKEMHGGTDDQVLREFADKLKYLTNLDKRKQEIADAITEQGKMTD